ncbi:hypothetical protein IC582_009430 [Cucumis melo]|uniref:Uncharacterized protein LOC103486481 n=2 Tax=Cucumis melo TaxID=3656 RepID=A0A1S3B6A3_CUCME|nr:uncharacterized protein LOC103486481 [Cucumis melo]XP_008442683.1 uncharacterized protein LOC103486481 [Cucumis melo]XP_050940137.1 uncharacterized protein LOC103486481 [Cucumis melo]XP_050940138.1 uncharacterized protein LOC103486481 [Cucumis melo]TYK25130.1 uncharacterized protein E5676_scaffold352G002550 [Cucumis melo var. makuwa]
MGGDRKRILIGLTVAMFVGLVVYMKLWTIDYSMSTDEAELLRRQFDLANREAMDESAEWRRMYDNELDRANRCKSELNQLKASFEKVGDAARINEKLTKMQEENFALRTQVDALQRRLEAEKSRCGSQ